ncbi:uncharacterized protein A1O9_02061 [Exophiala aquamarina CBS 119918]|uniref:Ubiquitin carrier protein n=1 Tax=Exophiala aquamarina CBS 119918 TaxID=1182545 RepID=A0A072PY14_9EURO|nr:uncharacterized protein A1O9_02061 [Exophiala aquamarina CBS 119918]KEF60500.1 hypothetical protein A1O9_02061 [Exophiala aquamarina CBS 119918]
MSLSQNLVRRGLDAAHGMHGMMSGSDQGDKKPVHVSPIAALIFFLTALSMVALVFSIGYTYGHIVPTLCMIESSETEAYVPVNNIDPTDPPAYSATAVPKPTNGTPANAESDAEMDEPEGLLVRNKPITASIRQTILHLRARAGYMSRFRGLSMYLVWNFASGILISILSGASGVRIYIALAAIVAETLLATLHMTWVHIVISEPSEKKWYQRIPSFRTWPKIAPAVALWATANQLVSVLPMLVTGAFGPMKHMHNPEYEPEKKDLYAFGAQTIFGALLMLALFLLLQIPASVTLVRVAASMLPEEDETIVPFDRTFGGKTTPAIIGGQGKIGLVEAWRSFSWASRMRLVRLMAKVALIAISCWVLVIVVVVAEAHLLFGDSLGEVMKSLHGATHSN